VAVAWFSSVADNEMKHRLMLYDGNLSRNKVVCSTWARSKALVCCVRKVVRL
jgi:hypothetical protein